MLAKEFIDKSNFLYHVTRSSNRTSIKNTGLIPQNKEFLHLSRIPGIYCMQTLDEAKDWAFWFMFEEHEAMDIWQINIASDEELDIEPDKSEDIDDIYQAWIIYNPIPPQLLKLVATQPVRKSTEFYPTNLHLPKKPTK